MWDERYKYTYDMGTIAPERSTVKKVDKMIKKGKPLPTYEDYHKYADLCVLDENEWNERNIYLQYEKYKEAKNDHHSFIGFCIFCGIIFVGGIVGGILYGIWIDDILTGISIAAGFPLFLIASCLGAGKGL